MKTNPNGTSITPEILLSLPEVLSFIGVSESTWFAGVASGRFPAPLKCGRRSFWPQSVIAEFIESLKQPQGTFNHD
jgi:prophage regulatory protein